MALATRPLGTSGLEITRAGYGVERIHLYQFHVSPKRAG